MTRTSPTAIGLNGWSTVTPSQPCLICGKPDWCRRNGDAARCMRITEAPGGWTRIKRDAEGGTTFKPVSSSSTNGVARRDFAADAKRYAEAVTDERVQELAGALGVSADALRSIGCGWSEADRAWVFPERDENGKIIGIVRRFRNGKKRSIKGSKRGLTIPDDLQSLAGQVLIVEGQSDVAALLSKGVAAVGRPSNKAGADLVAKLLRDRADGVFVVGENDAKDNGDCPGRDGAIETAKKLALKWKRPVRWTMPPEGVKDMRSWFAAQSDLSLDEVMAVLGANAETIEPDDADDDDKEPTVSQSETLVQLAEADFRIGQSMEGEPFAVERDRRNIALMFRGSRSALRARLANQYRIRHSRTPSAQALSDALTVLEGMAQDAKPEPVHLRVAAHGDGFVLDLGDETARAVHITPAGWQVVNRSPVLFRRSALTGAMPEPLRGGSLDELRELLNITDESWPLVLAWLVAALFPGIPHPILLLGGEQGAGKSTAARLLLALFDASPAPLRSEPRDAEQWAVALSGSWAVGIDNVSRILAWWSDALCKAVTGDGWVRRKLYSDSDLSVLAFRRVVVMTSIDPGAMRGDLGDRLVLVDLEPIGEQDRKAETDIDARYAEAHPRLFGALLDMVVEVVRRLPDVHLDRLPRMADFGRVLKAVDGAADTDGFAGYIGQRKRIAEDIIESDSVAMLVQKMMEGRAVWQGTAKQLCDDLRAVMVEGEKVPRGFPANPRAMAAWIKRTRQAMAAAGITITRLGPTGQSKSRLYAIETGGNIPSASSAPSANAAGGAQNADLGADGSTDGTDGSGLDRPPDRPREIPAHKPENANTDGTDGTDGISQPCSVEGDQWTF